MRLTKSLKNAITDHAWQVYPHECCGLIIDGKYQPCVNTAVDTLNNFEIDPAMLIDANIQAIVHSHPNGNAEPSEIDKVQMGLHGMDWVIVGLGVHSDGEAYCTIKTHRPKAYQAPLIGRDYYHGTQDCYSLVRDFYSREMGIELNDYPRTDAWWEDASHEPLYETYFAKEGFVKIDAKELRFGDAILCRIGRTHHINHALIYLGDAKLTSEKTTPIIGNNLVLHHPYGRLSVREIYGESLQKRTAMIVRYNHENH